MTDPYADIDDERLVASLQDTYFADKPLHQGRYRRKPVPPWHLAALAGAGGLRATGRYRPSAAASARCRIPRSIRCVMTKLMTETVSTSSGVHRARYW